MDEVREVPPRYRGLWRRALLEQGGQTDTATQAWWLQTRVWHGDLRIPPGRPDFAGVAGVEECTRTHLEWLLRQEGFAGITEVEGEQCVWNRRFDYRPTGFPDIGRMRFDGDVLEENGVAQAYFERWQRDPGTQALLSAHSSHSDGRVRLLLRAGDFFMFFMPRPSGADWTKVVAGQASEDEMRRFADFEISFGRLEGTEWCIAHSTLPWREGRVLSLDGNWVDLGADVAEKETK